MKRLQIFTRFPVLIGAVIVLLSFSFTLFPDGKMQQLVAKSNLFHLRFPQEKIYLHIDRPSYWANDDIWFKAYLLDSPIKEGNLYVELLHSSGEVIYKNRAWYQNGLSYGNIHLADTISSGVYQIRAYTNWMRNFDNDWFFRKDLVIWNQRDKEVEIEKRELRSRDIDLQFFPEGGTFVTNLKNKVAVKVVDQSGNGMDFEGEIVDNSGNKIAEIKSQINGIGNFYIKPVVGKNYTAKVVFAGGINKNFDLPKAQEEGVVLSMGATDTTFIQLQVSGKLYVGEETSLYYLVGQAGGQVFYQHEVKMVNDTFKLNLNKNELPGGILKFTLFNKDALPLCERVVFNQKIPVINLKVEPDKPGYSTREKIGINVKAFDIHGTPFQSNLSLSVFNPENQSKIEDYPKNIFTQFFLSSELKGKIENPAWYFKDDSLSTLTALDNLMLTHGYRQFEWREIMEDEFPEIDYEPEPSIQLKGTVVSIVRGKPIPDCKVTMMTVKSLLSVEEETSDSLGRFLFTDLYFNDTIQVSLQALNKKGRRNTVIIIDNRSGISPRTTFSPSPFVYINESQYDTEFYLSDLDSNLINKEWRLSDTILLGDINIKAKRREKEDGHFRMYAEADFIFDTQKNTDLIGNVYDAIDGKLPGVRHELDREAFIYRGKPTLLYLDGIPVDYDLLRTFPYEAFDKIELVRMGIFSGVNYDGGIIYFYTKRGEMFINMPTDGSGMKSAKIIGYSVIRQFYSPNYETQEYSEIKDDLRKTLYWDPVVMTDSTGMANVSYYNSDETGNMQIVVEGITSDGKLCRGEAEYEVRF